MPEPAQTLSCIIDPDVIDAPALIAVKSYWDEKRGARAMPRRSDIDPHELRDHLGHIFMMDVLGPAEFRFRLLGTGITGRYGRDSTGKTVREVYAKSDPALFEAMTGLFVAVTETHRPVLSRGTLTAVGKDFVAYDSIQLPLSDDGQRVNMIIGATRFIAERRAR